MNSINDWRGQFCLEINPTPAGLVIFGASGDLAGRKLFPALLELFQRQLLPEPFRIIGCGRHNWDSHAFQQHLAALLPSNSQTGKFLERCDYLTMHYNVPQDYRKLADKLAEWNKLDTPLPLNHAFYLATPPQLSGVIVKQLCENGLMKKIPSGPWRHLILEKPFGFDSESAAELEKMLKQQLTEDQIYRIDHYLGKETVQNIAILRFANLLFEPLWNRHYIEKVEITVAEALGVEQRAGYFEQAGILRDMFQNHLLEMLSLAAMEMPGNFSASAIRQEKLKLLKAIRPLDPATIQNNWVRGQYSASATLPGYRQEAGVAPDSQTETYAAGCFYIDNWRWQGVPFFLRAGKRLQTTKTEIVLTFKAVPSSIFQPIQPDELARNTLILKIQPKEGMELTLQAKQPGPKLCMGKTSLQFEYPAPHTVRSSPLSAYSRLFLDAFLGDRMLFTDRDFIAESWRIFTPLLEAWKNAEICPLEFYQSGSEGPSRADGLTEWRSLNN